MGRITKILSFLSIISILCAPLYGVSRKSTLFQEEDGSESRRYLVTKWPNGTITDNGDGSGSFNLAGGGAQGADTNVQFNDGGAFSGDAAFTYDKTVPVLTIGDGTEEDISFILDGNAQDFHIAVDDTTDDLTIGTGATIGSNVKMVIENGGNVGIGTASPDSQLHVFKVGSSATIKVETDTSGSAYFITDRTDDTEEASVNFHTNGVLNWKIGMDNLPVFSVNDLTFKDTNNAVPKMVIKTGTGRVGIGGGGSVNPDAQLETQTTFAVGKKGSDHTDARGALIEVVADDGGEASGRLFFPENNDDTTPANNDKFGLSLYYQGYAGATLPSGMVLSTGNATWGLMRHSGTLNGEFIMAGLRTDSNVVFYGDIDITGTTPRVLIGDAGEEDTSIVYDGAAQNYYIGLDDTDDDLKIGLGSAVGTTPAISIEENLDITTYADVTMTGTTPTLTIGDAGTEDTVIIYDGNAQDFYVGLDDTDDDFKIGLGAAVGTTTHMNFTEAGEITKPLQPLVLVLNSVQDSDVTGDGTTYQVICDTELADRNADYNNSTGVFTAPVTGLYKITALIQFGDLAVGHTELAIFFVTSNRSYTPTDLNGAAVMDPDGNFYISVSQLADMDAADTVFVSIVVFNGAKVVDIGNTTYCSFELVG